MFKKLKWLYKIGSIVRKVYRYKLALAGGVVFIWELLASVPEILVLVAGGIAALIGLGKGSD